MAQAAIFRNLNYIIKLIKLFFFKNTVNQQKQKLRE
jgi:hypothetical protein